MTILIYCGARTGSNPRYADAAVQVADALVDRGHALVYGGGSVGIMGVLARRVLERGGHVTGIIPSFMKTEEIALPDCTELIEVPSMHARKLAMFERADGILALAGGYGTMDELFEVVTWRQIGLHGKPIGVLNTDGFYDHLSLLIDRMLDDDFIKPVTHGLIRFDADALPLLDWMEAHETDTNIDPLLPRWT